MYIVFRVRAKFAVSDVQPQIQNTLNRGIVQRYKVNQHSSNQMKSKLLVLGAVNTTINDQGCQHVTGGGLESIRMLLSKQTGWPTVVQSRPSVKKTVE